MATNARTAPDWLAPYEPTLPLPRLVEEVNRLYHRHEANRYDRRHPELSVQCPAYWAEMAAIASRLRPSAKWHILDFGCGTGFATLQLLERLPLASVASVTCYDLSREMLARCQEKVSAIFPNARFTTNLDDLSADRPFNLLATNSLLHHLPDVHGTLASLATRLSPDAVWLAGHEPSSRYYRNAACVEALERYRSSRSDGASSWNAPHLPFVRAWRKLQRSITAGASPKRRAAADAHRAGLFGKRPTPTVIDRLVDYHVAHSVDEAAAGRGFDYEALAEELRGRWRLAWVRTYSYMGSHYEANLSAAWRAECLELARRFPRDGANFCAMWERAAA